MPNVLYQAARELLGLPPPRRLKDTPTRGQNRALEARYRRYEKHHSRTPKPCALTHHAPMRCLLDGWIRRGQPIVYLPRGMMLFGDAGPAPYGWMHAQCADDIGSGGQHVSALLRPSVQRLAAAAGELRRGLEPVADAVTRMYEHLQLRPVVFDHVREAREARWSFEPDPTFDMDTAWQTFGSVQEVPGAVIELPTTPQYTTIRPTEPADEISLAQRTMIAMTDWTPRRIIRLVDQHNWNESRLDVIDRLTRELAAQEEQLGRRLLDVSVHEFGSELPGAVAVEVRGRSMRREPFVPVGWDTITVPSGSDPDPDDPLDRPITTTYDPATDWGALPQPPGPGPGMDTHPVVAWDPARCWKCDREPGLDALDGMCDRCYPALTGNPVPDGVRPAAAGADRSQPAPAPGVYQFTWDFVSFGFDAPSDSHPWTPRGGTATITLRDGRTREYTVTSIRPEGITLTPVDSTRTPTTGQPMSLEGITLTMTDAPTESAQ